MIHPFIEKWASASGLSGTQILRFTILRDLLEAIHTRRSVLLAQGPTDEVRTLQSLEQKIESLLLAKELNGDLEQTIEESSPQKEPAKLSPSSKVLKVVGAEKANRFDRIWSTRIAMEAEKANWNFYRLEGWIDLTEAVQVHTDLQNILWPNGTILWVESAQRAAPTDRTPGDSRWKGCWVFVLNPEVSPGQLLSKLPSRFFSKPEAPKIMQALSSEAV